MTTGTRLSTGSIAQLRARLRRSPGPIGFVPTMGALHSGHARLIDAARAECGTVAVSIFVNPLQFDRDDDLRRYPRTLDADLHLCAAHGVDVVFVPSVDEMYPRPMELTVKAGRMAEHLCGAFRPGHFDGVATVVLKLLQIVAPARAYFGEKDAQQLAIIRRLVLDFNLDVTVVGVPTLREPDGLAMSSRNVHLSPVERALAPRLFQALGSAREAVERGRRDSEAIRKDAVALIASEPGMRLEYFEIVDPLTLQPVAEIDREVLIASAVWIGGTRLIDNITIEVRG